MANASSASRSREQSTDLLKVYCDLQIQTLLIAIPTAGGPSPDSWKADNQNETWLKSLDPKQTLHLGIFSFPNHLGSDLPPISWSNIEQQGSLFLSALLRHIQVNDALCIALHNSDQYAGILQNISCLVLLGCPHSTKKTIDHWKGVSDIFQLFPGGKFKHAISKELATGLGNDCIDFERAVGKKAVINLYETHTSKKPGLFKSKGILVPEENVSMHRVPGWTMPVDTDHRHLCHLSQSTPHFDRLIAEVESASKDVREKIQSTLSESRFALPTMDQRSWIGPNQNEPIMVSNEGTAGSSIASFQVIPSLADFSISKRDPQLPCKIIPYGQHRSFLGRASVLKHLWHALDPSGSQGLGNSQSVDTLLTASSASDSCLKSVALCGPGGMGKTQVAIEFAHRHKDNFDAVFWVQADEPAKMAQSFTKIAVQLGFVAADSPETQDETLTKELVIGWLCKSYRSFKALEDEAAEEATWLVIFDNVDNPDILDGSLPVGGSGSILITSRDPLLIPYLPSQSESVVLEPLESSEATKLLLDLTRRRKSKSREDLDGAVSVAELLGGLPLALAQMAGVIARDDLSFNEFKSMYEKKMQHQDLFNRKIPFSKHRTGYEHSLASVWALDSLHLSAVLLACISLLDPDGIPEYIFDAEGLTEIRHGYPLTISGYANARTELLHSSLISREKEKSSIRIHRLIQDAARSRMSSEDFSSTFTSTLLLLSRKWPYEEFSFGNAMSRWIRLDELYPHILRVQKHFQYFSTPKTLSEVHIQGPKTVLDAAWHSIMRSRFEETLLLVDMGRAMCEALMSDPNRFQPFNKALNDELEDLYRISYHHRGVRALHTNQPEVSLPDLLRFTELLRKKHNGDLVTGTDQSLGVAWNELGNAYLQKGDKKEAESCFLKSIAALRALDGHDEYSISMPLINLAFAYWLANKLSTALETFKKALKHREDKLGVDDTDSFVTGKLLLGYGNVSYSLGNAAEAFNLHQRCLKQYRSTVGDNHHRTADACVKVAHYYTQFGMHLQSWTLLSQAIRIWSNHSHFTPERVRAHHRRGRLLRMMMKEKEARSDFDAVNVLWKILSPQDGRDAEQLTDNDFEGKIMFWSR